MQTDPTILEPGGIAPSALRRAMWTGEAKPLRRFWDRCDWNEPIITARPAETDSPHETVRLEFNRAVCRPV